MSRSGTYTPLCQLDNHSKRWEVLARCTHKTELSKYGNRYKEGTNTCPKKDAICVFAGTLFSFNLLDENEGRMRCVAFDRAAEKFYDRVKVGSTYKISNAAIARIRKTEC